MVDLGQLSSNEKHWASFYWILIKYWEDPKIGKLFSENFSNKIDFALVLSNQIIFKIISSTYINSNITEVWINSLKIYLLTVNIMN